MFEPREARYQPGTEGTYSILEYDFKCNTTSKENYQNVVAMGSFHDNLLEMQGCGEGGKFRQTAQLDRLVYLRHLYTDTHIRIPCNLQYSSIDWCTQDIRTHTQTHGQRSMDKQLNR